MSVIDLVAGGLVTAYLEIEEPQVPDPVIPFCFNPAEYQLQKSNNFAEIAIPGLESPPIQYIRGAAEKLSAELLVDTSDTLEDVRVAYVDKLQALMRINSELHAPPIVRFIWDTAVFRGVMESLGVTFILFSPEGVPLRAKLAVVLKEYRPIEIQVKQSPKNSPDVNKAYTVRLGDTLSGIAGKVYRDPAAWREIARENGITDPRRLEPGLTLNLPKLR